MPEKLINVRETAEFLGIPRNKIRELVEKGELPAYKIGGKFIRFRKEQVEAIRNEILSKVGQFTPQVQASSSGETDRQVQEISYSQSARDSFMDFFYFNDFYLVAAVIACLLLFFIFS